MERPFCYCVTPGDNLIKALWATIPDSLHHIFSIVYKVPFFHALVPVTIAKAGHKGWPFSSVAEWQQKTGEMVFYAIMYVCSTRSTLSNLPLPNSQPIYRHCRHCHLILHPLPFALQRIRNMSFVFLRQPPRDIWHIRSYTSTSKRQQQPYKGTLTRMTVGDQRIKQMSHAREKNKQNETIWQMRHSSRFLIKRKQANVCVRLWMAQRGNNNKDVCWCPEQQLNKVIKYGCFCVIHYLLEWRCSDGLP